MPLVEIAPNEIRTVCDACGRVIPQRRRWCDTCARTKGKTCELCGNPALGAKCKTCLRYGPPKVALDRYRLQIEELWAQREPKLTIKQIFDQLGLRSNHPGTIIVKARKRGWNLPYRNPAASKNAAKKIGRLNKAKVRSPQRTDSYSAVAATRKSGRSLSADLQKAVERMWAEGLTAREICENVGWDTRKPSNAITKARKRGWNLPYRIPGMRDFGERMREYH